MAQVTKMDMIQFLPARKRDTNIAILKQKQYLILTDMDNGKSSHISKI